MRSRLSYLLLHLPTQLHPSHRVTAALLPNPRFSWFKISHKEAQEAQREIILLSIILLKISHEEAQEAQRKNPYPSAPIRGSKKQRKNHFALIYFAGKIRVLGVLNWLCLFLNRNYLCASLRVVQLLFMGFPDALTSRNAHPDQSGRPRWRSRIGRSSRCCRR
jgi:hypothetical protein